VLIGPTNGVECPEGVLSSLVWLVASYQGVDFGRDILAVSSQRAFKVVFGVGEGESGLPNALTPISGSSRDCVYGMVERSPKIGDNIRDGIIEEPRRLLCEAHLMDLALRDIRIRLGKEFIQVFLPMEMADNPFDFDEVMLCPLNLAARTVEGIGHGGGILCA
jgi:hypothetical protein